MWWAQTSWWNNIPGVTVTPSSLGLEVAGTVIGPPNPFLGLGGASYRLKFAALFWLGTDRMPPAGCKWVSKATAVVSGTISGSTFGGVWPFGPWPRTMMDPEARQLISSGSTVIADSGEFSLGGGRNPLNELRIIDNANTSASVSMPADGKFPAYSSTPFELDRTQGFGIELDITFYVNFTGTGIITFGSSPSNPVIVGFPQFDIESID